MKTKGILKKLQAAQARYDGAIGEAESLVSGCADFEMSISYQPSDGFVVIDEDANNSPLTDCLCVINQKGVLTHADYLKLRI